MDRETLGQFSEKIERLLKIYPQENLYSMYVPLGSHDTERILTALEGNFDKLKFAYLFQFAFPGAPAIYYGDEVGLEGGRDPECRAAFPWDPAQWKGDLQPWVRELIALRKTRISLRRGDFSKIMVDDEKGILAFTRTLGEEKTLIVLNTSKDKQDTKIPVKTLELARRSNRKITARPSAITVINGKLPITLTPLSGMYIG